MSDNGLTDVMTFVSTSLSIHGLKVAPLLSLFSAWVVVLVFACLNLHTRHAYFRLWALAWLFFSMFLAATIGLESRPDLTVLAPLGRACIGISALCLYAGNLQLTGHTRPSGSFVMGVILMVAWSCLTEYVPQGRIWGTVVPCILLALASTHTAVLYLKSCKHHKGAILLATSLLLWSLHMAAFPIQASAPLTLKTMGYLASALLGLCVALGMILLALEQARERTDSLLGEFKKGMTQRRLLEQEVNASEQKYRRLFDSASDAIFLIDLATLEVLEANAAAAELAGCDCEKLIGRSFASLCPKLRRPTTSLLENKKLVEELFHPTGEFQIRRDQNEEVLCEGSVALMDYQRHPSLQVNAREITGRKKMEQQLRQAEKLSALGQLVAGVAHELNNPLAVVMGYAQLLVRNRGLEEKPRQDLAKILHESERAAKIVRNLLTFARPREPHMAMIDVNRLVTEALDTLDIQVQGANVRVIRQLAPGLPPTMADPNQIEQVLANLVTNAIQALENHPNQRVIEVTTEKRDHRIRIAVADNGPGIPLQLLDRIFDPFFTTKGPGKGTGLGLSICYSIMEEHKGKIWVESHLGKGSRFILELPVATGPEVVVERSGDADEREADPECQERRLLVVDDEPGIVDVLKEVLSNGACRVDTASNGAEALSRIAAQHYDLIISDLCMPEMGGERLHAAIVEQYPHLQERMIFVTGDTVSPASRRFLEQSGARWLSKPFNIATLEKLVNTHLQSEPVQTVQQGAEESAAHTVPEA